METLREMKTPTVANYRLSDSDQLACDWVNERMDRMDETRAEEEAKWSRREKVMESKVHASKDGKAQVNIPLEAVLREVYVWGLPKLQYKVDKKSGKIEHDYKMIYEIVFDHMIDIEEVIPERTRFENAKFTYWTGVLYSWVWFETKHIYDGNGTEFFNKDASTKKYEIRHIGIKDIDIRKAWFDENAKRYKDCSDCIMEEELPWREFKTRYWDNERFSNVEYVGIYRDDYSTESTTGQKAVIKEIVKLRHYWNKIDGSYIIVANEKVPIYNGVYTCKHGLLPLMPVQHYYRHDSIYGVSWAERLQTVRPYINSILKVALDGSWLNASPAIISDDLVEVDGDYYLEAWVLNEISATGDAKGVTQFQTNINVWQLVDILKLMEDYGMVTTGLNFKAPYTSPETTAFEVWVMKEEQNNRAKPVMQLDHEWRDKALSIMLVNVVDFAPFALAEKLHWEDEDGETKQPERYTIAVEDKKIEVKNGKHFIKDEVGYIEELQLTPDLFVHGNWLRVKITTPYTTTLLNALKKEELNKYVELKMSVAGTTWDISFLWDLKELNELIDETYWYDSDDMRVKTKADERKKKFSDTQEILTNIQTALSPTPRNVQASKEEWPTEVAEVEWGATIL